MLSVVLLCCASLFAVTSSLPTGAPDVTCDNLMPNGPHVANGIVEQPTANPWTIDVCDFDEIMGYYTYQPGQTYNSKLACHKHIYTILCQCIVVSLGASDTKVTAQVDKKANTLEVYYNSTINSTIHVRQSICMY